MRENHIRLGIIGGDMRQAKMAESFAGDGYPVVAFALENAIAEMNVKQAQSLEETVAGADCVILPLPAFGEGYYLNTPMSSKKVSLMDIVSRLTPYQLVVGGKLDANAVKAFSARGISILDYLNREDLAVANAVPTAEGAIQIAMEELPITIHNSNCLVIGYGRIGKMLSSRLQLLGAKVSVSARNTADLAMIEAINMRALKTNALSGKLGSFDVIFNTVPAAVLTKELLLELKPDCLCVDLASKPGGIDFYAAAEIGLKAIWALSLPGKVAPVTSGLIIKNVINNILEEQGRGAAG